MFSDILISILPMIVVFAEDVFVNNWLGFYEWSGLDIPMHLIGGFVTAWSAARLYHLWNLKQGLIIKPVIAVYIWFIAITALVGILWEIYEFLLDPFVTMVMQATVKDTIGDLVNDLLGAAVFCVIMYWWKRN